MMNILIWGTGMQFKAREDVIASFMEKGLFRVTALISRDEEAKEWHGIPIVRKENINQFQWERIIVAAGGAAVGSIRRDAEAMGIPADKVIQLNDWLLERTFEDSEAYEAIIDRQCKVISELLAASDEEVADFKWIKERMGEFGIYPFQNYEDVSFLTELGILQVPDEFARFCNHISKLKVQTAIEVGVFRGRSSYFICALLSRHNPDLSYKLVDIKDMLDSYERFHELLPAMQKCVPSTSNDYRGEAYDFVFIDADHSYDGSMLDYTNLGRYAKRFLVFHDIYAHEYDEENGGTVRMWQEVSAKYGKEQQQVFSAYPGQWMGIGCINM